MKARYLQIGCPINDVGHVFFIGLVSDIHTLTISQTDRNLYYFGKYTMFEASISYIHLLQKCSALY